MSAGKDPTKAQDVFWLLWSAGVFSRACKEEQRDYQSSCQIRGVSSHGTALSRNFNSLSKPGGWRSALLPHSCSDTLKVARSSPAGNTCPAHPRSEHQHTELRHLRWQHWLTRACSCHTFSASKALFGIKTGQEHHYTQLTRWEHTIQDHLEKILIWNEDYLLRWPPPTSPAWNTHRSRIVSALMFNTVCPLNIVS